MRHVLLSLIVWLALAGAAVGGYGVIASPGVGEPRAVAPGVTFQTATMHDGGRVHLAKIESEIARVWVTPVEPGVDWPLRLTRTADVSRRQGLTVVVNCAWFTNQSLSVPVGSRSLVFRRAGDLAHPEDPSVAGGRLSFWTDHRRLVWFDAAGQGRLDERRPFPRELAESAAYAVSQQSSAVIGGRYDWTPDTGPTAQSAIALRAGTGTVWLAHFDHATIKAVADYLVGQGATDVVVNDGGGSASMAVNGVPVAGDWRPTPHHIGFGRP